jgi:tetratricopeptide (TPR) repeat protein
VSIRQWRRAPQIALVIGLLFTAYALVANVLRIGTIFGERLFYWPSAFAIILIAWALIVMFRWLHASRLPILTTAAGLLLLAAIVGMFRVTWVRNTDWENNVTLAVATGRDNVMSGKACSWAGTALLDSGLPQFRPFGLSLLLRAIELSPEYVTPRWELAKYYGIERQLGKSVDAVAEAARLDPGTHATSAAVAGVLEALRVTDPKDYMPDIENYQREHPTDEAAYFASALGYHAQRKFDLAEKSARKALDLGKRPIPGGTDQFHEAAAEMAAVQFERGEYASAIDIMRKYAFYMRNSVDAHCAFASLLMAVDPAKFPEALKEAELNLAIAHEIDPGNILVRDIRGRLTQKEKSAGNVMAASLTALGQQLRRNGTGGQP